MRVMTNHVHCITKINLAFLVYVEKRGEARYIHLVV